MDSYPYLPRFSKRILIPEVEEYEISQYQLHEREYPWTKSMKISPR